MALPGRRSGADGKRFRFEPMNDVLFYTQAQIITRLADTEDCIIVGRCANDILKSRPNIPEYFSFMHHWTTGFRQ